MDETLSFDDLMSQLRRGDNDAASQIFRRYASRLIALARTRLNDRLRQKIDPEDILQSVFRSFFIRHADGQLDLENWDSLWAFLVVLTLRKCGRNAQYFHRARRDVNREVASAGASDNPDAILSLASSEPTAEETTLLIDTIEHLMRGLDEEESQILVYRLQGHTVAEIAPKVGCNERRAQRVLKLIRQRLERLRAKENEADA